VSFSQNGELFVTAGQDSYAKLWNVQGQQLARWDAHPTWYPNSVSLTADGRRVATAGDRFGTVKLWDVEQLKTLEQLKTHQQPVPLIEWGSEQLDGIDEMSFSIDGYLATADKDGTVKIWDTKKIVSQSNGGRRSPVLLTQLKGHQGQVLSVHFSTDGQLLATSGEDSTARIWNVKGQQLAQLKGHQGRVLKVRFSTDGQLLATSGEDGTVRIWNVKGQQEHELKGYGGLVSSLSFSPDGKLLATGGQDSTVRLWNLKGQQLTRLFTYQGWIRSVNFSKDGQQIITAGEDGTVQIRHLSEIKDLDGLLKQGCDWLKDYLVSHPDALQVCSDIK
jgi:WD40 repeat protein